MTADKEGTIQIGGMVVDVRVTDAKQNFGRTLLEIEQVGTSVNRKPPHLGRLRALHVPGAGMMRMAIGHYLACHGSCCCQGCKEGLAATLWLAFFGWLQKKSKALGSWAYRMEMRAYR